MSETQTSNRTLDKCWEQPLYPINGSELHGDLSTRMGGGAMGQHYAVTGGLVDGDRFLRCDRARH